MRYLVHACDLEAGISHVGPASVLRSCQIISSSLLNPASPVMQDVTKLKAGMDHPL